METEIRFALTPDLALRLEQLYLADDSGTTEHNETIYFDTPTHQLWRDGGEFRVRQNAKGTQQTLKYRTHAVNPFARQEVEIALASPVPDMAWLRRELPPALAASTEGADFVPVFRTVMIRRKVTFPHRGAMIELAYDRGEILAGTHVLPILEVELELLEGSAADLADAALAFVERVPAALRTQGKAARGYRLAAGFSPQPVYQEQPFLTPTTPLPEAIAALLRSGFVQSLANQAALLDSDLPEAVHQMRVGLRRMRSMVSAFRPVLDLSGVNDLLEETRTFFTLLGDVREADVFLTETIAQFPAEFGGADRPALLVREVERFRSEARKAVQGYAGGPAFARLALRWLRWIEGGGWMRNEQPLDRLLQTRPVSQFAVGRLAEMRKKLQKRAHVALHGTISDWHEARIAAKKLRYAGGPLLHVVGENNTMARSTVDASQITRRLAKLQDELGTFNDLCMVAPFLERVGRDAPARVRHEYWVAAAYFSGWYDAQVRDAIPRLETRWKAFAEAMQETP